MESFLCAGMLSLFHTSHFFLFIGIIFLLSVIWLHQSEDVFHVSAELPVYAVFPFGFIHLLYLLPDAYYRWGLCRVGKDLPIVFLDVLLKPFRHRSGLPPFLFKVAVYHRLQHHPFLPALIA